LENPERIVSRDQLLIHIWPTKTFVDFDKAGGVDSSKTEVNNVAAPVRTGVVAPARHSRQSENSIFYYL
jgi:hypothetical protein